MYGLPEMVMDEGSIGHKLYIFLALYCALKYNSDASYLLEDTTLKFDRLSKLR